MMTIDALEEAARTKQILVVDDQLHVREALRLLLKSDGYAVHTAASPGDALAAVASADFDLIIVDMNFSWDTTSGQEGLRLLDDLRAGVGIRTQRAAPVITPVITMTGWSTIELAVEAMQRGACDFITKPWDNGRFLSVIRKHVESPRKARQSDPDLALARLVQTKLLPQPNFRACGLDCECASLPAGEIGGDLYDFFDLGSGAMAFLLGDVSGKGMPAALLMANLQATIRAQQDLAREPAKLMQRVNRFFFESTRPEYFATLFYGVFESGSRTLRYASCGHPSAILIRASGDVETLDATATVVGLFKDREFRECSVTLAAGDRLVLFSDGFSEAREEDDSWALKTIVSFAKSQPSGLAQALTSAAAGAGRQADDITVMDLRAGRGMCE